MSDTAKREAPPDLEHRAPCCTLCGNEVSDFGNDGWDCEGCGAYWPYSGYDGKWNESELPQCGGVIQPFLKVGPEHENIRTNEYRCLLSEGHKSEHRAEELIYWPRQD